MKEVHMVELFAGVGAQRQALTNLGVPCRVEISEIDSYAIRLYNAIHGETPNLGDISKLESLPKDIDILTYSFPCQDLSLAGDKRGMEEGTGTRSSLLWEVGRLLEIAERERELPGVLVMENVDAILHEDNFGEFQRWIGRLTNLGYTSTYKVLNATDFGVPQNRRRLFMVSFLTRRAFAFPTGHKLTTRLSDLLEADPDEKFYLTEHKLEKFERHIRNKFGGLGDSIELNQAGMLNCGSWDVVNRVYYPDGVSPTLTTCTGGRRVPKIAFPCNTKRGFMEAKEGDGLVLARVHKARGTVQDGLSPTLTTGHGCDTGTVVSTADGLRIRQLTPLECWRLMGFPDSVHQTANDLGISDTQQYKMAGNSIVVPVLEAIFREILKPTKNIQQMSLWDF